MHNDEDWDSGDTSFYKRRTPIHLVIWRICPQICTLIMIQLDTHDNKILCTIMEPNAFQPAAQALGTYRMPLLGQDDEDTISTVSSLRCICGSHTNHIRGLAAWYCPLMTFPRTLKKYQTSFRTPLLQPRWTCAPCIVVSADWISLEV